MKLRIALTVPLALAGAIGLTLAWSGPAPVNVKPGESAAPPSGESTLTSATEPNAPHHDHRGCDPLGPVRVVAERNGDSFRIETSATLPYRGELRVTTRLPVGVQWIDGTSAWTGEGSRTLRFDGDPGGAAGQVEVRMLSEQGEIFVDQAALVFDETAGNRVVEARAIDSERGALMDIPAKARTGGGR